MALIDGARVVNLYDCNAASWLSVFTNPIAAHTGHLRNREMWEVLVRRYN